MCYEHTPSEGIAVVTAMLNILKSMESMNPEAIELKENEDIKSKEMAFVLNNDIKNMIVQASENLDKLDSDVDIEVFKFEGYGKSFIKTCNCSPDAYMQMSLQLAYYRYVYLPAKKSYCQNQDNK